MTDTIRGIVWVDAAGGSRLTTPQANGSLSSIVTEMLAVSNATVAYYWEGARTVPGGTPTASTYLSTRDAAILVFNDAACNEVRLTLPAPDSSIFMADEQTVDPTAVSSLIAACLGVLQTGAGGVVTAYIAGYRVRS